MYLFETVDMEGKPKFVFVDGEKRVRVEIRALLKEVFKSIRKFKYGKIASALLMLFFYAAYMKEITVQCFSFLTRRKEKFKRYAEDKLKRYGTKMDRLLLEFSLIGVNTDEIIERIGEMEVRELKDKNE